MTWGRTLWILILIKLFVMFVILKIFFFPQYLNRFNTAAAGPIVMNSQQQLMEAFSELEHGEFVKQEAGYENQ